MDNLMLTLFLILIMFGLAIKQNTSWIILSLLFFIICYCLYNTRLMDSGKEKFKNYAHLDYSMGEYSNLELKPEGKSHWRHAPSDVPILDDSLKVYQGNQLPENKITRHTFDNIDAPFVTGEPGSPRSLFMFSNNQCRPECCPSTFSCDKGCVCTTEQQRKFINNRGIPHTNTNEY